MGVEIVFYSYVIIIVSLFVCFYFFGNVLKKWTQSRRLVGSIPGTPPPKAQSLADRKEKNERQAGLFRYTLSINTVALSTHSPPKCVKEGSYWPLSRSLPWCHVALAWYPSSTSVSNLWQMPGANLQYLNPISSFWPKIIHFPSSLFLALSLFLTDVVLKKHFRSASLKSVWDVTLARSLV